jgi:apolipoprotein N-acyltransferase
MPGRSPLCDALRSGALLAVAALPGPGGPLAFVALVPLFRSLSRGVGAPRALGAGLLAGALHDAVGFGWVPFVEVEAGPPPVLAYLMALPILAAGSGALAVVVSALAARSRSLALAAAPGLWVALEQARAHEALLGVPWNQLGYGLAEWPALAQGASLAGVPGLSFWIVSVNAWLAAGPRLANPAHRVLAALLAAPLLSGAALLADPPPRDALRVAAVQPDLGERERRDPRRFGANLRALYAGSRRALAAPADLVAWPESAYQRPLGSQGDAFLAALAHDLGTPLLTGAWRAEEGALRNAAVLALPGGGTPFVAEKQHPVPVYEGAPARASSRWLARRGFWPGRFARGREHGPFLLPRSGAPAAAVGALVCADASHPEVARRLRRAGARLLVAISNEAASGRWSAALHARVARLRAAEGRVPVVRVASRGPSLWIDAHGRVVASLPAGRSASAGHELPLAGPSGPYVRLGEARIAAAAALSALVAGGLAFTPGRARRAPACGPPPGNRGTPA